MYLCQAIDQNDEVFDFLVQASLDKKVASKRMPKLLRKHGFIPRTVVAEHRYRRGQAFTAWRIGTCISV